ncbi:MAG: radical SAM protein [Deltaproteobacteria bacterium]|nr:radical SAM protein [Deltaproteobacteria bacterium]
MLKRKYKASGYNTIVKNKDNKYTYYNSISGSIISVDEESHLIASKTIEDPNNIHEEDTNILDTLIENRFIIDKETNELNILKSRMNISRYNTDKLSMTITMTMMCNLRCEYCYEEHANKKMNLDTINNVLNFIEKESEKKDAVFITWFGGEPLLEIENIRYMSEKIIEICRRNKCYYEASIITNGYLLNKNIVENLYADNITSLQITLDGTKEYHDKRKYQVNGDGTFDRIVENLELIPDDITITIRINVDKINSSNIAELFTQLQRFRNKENFRFITAPTEDTSTDKSYRLQNNCFSTEEYAKWHSSLMNNKNIVQDLKSDKPNINSCKGCSAIQYNNFVIGTEGEIYKCYIDIGKNSIGVIEENGMMTLDFNLLSNWLAFNPFEIEECINCKTLPLCLGGCLIQRKLKKNICSPWKYNLENYLSNI